MELKSKKRDQESQKPASRTLLCGIIGNLLDHYDNALYGLVAPFLAPLFLGNQDPLSDLILLYSLLPLGLFARF